MLARRKSNPGQLRCRIEYPEKAAGSRSAGGTVFNTAALRSATVAQTVAAEPIHSFGDWEKFALPPERRKRHWVEGRSAYELGFIWTTNGQPSVPAELEQLLDSHEETKGIEILSGVTEHETRRWITIPRCWMDFSAY